MSSWVTEVYITTKYTKWHEKNHGKYIHAGS